MVIGEAMRTFTYLNLYGYLTDAVIVNRIFPSEVGDYFAGWRRMQEEHLELVRSAFAPVPVLCAPVLRHRGARRARCSTGSPTRCSAPAGSIRPPSSTTRSPRS